MHYIEEKYVFVLSSGRIFFALGGMLCPSTFLRGSMFTGLESTGLDHGTNGPVSLVAKKGEVFTPTERREIADEFISRWEKWANSPCPFAGGANGGHHSDDCRCQIDNIIR